MTAASDEAAVIRCAFDGSAKYGNKLAADGNRPLSFELGMIEPGAIWRTDELIILGAGQVAALQISDGKIRPCLHPAPACLRRVATVMCAAHTPVLRHRASLLKPLGFFHNLNTRCACAHSRARASGIAVLSFSKS